MANYLKVNMQESVRHFYNNLQWSKRRIARELKINRRTVSKYINEDSKCTISTTGFPVQNSDDMLSKCTISTTGSEGRKSLCAPWHDYIKNKLTAQLSAQRIYQDLVLEHGFDGSYESVKRYVKKLDDDGALSP